MSVRVLLVDDNVLLRSSLAELIGARRPGVSLREAADIREALAQAETFQPQLVLLNAGTRGQEGRPAAALLRRELPRARLVALAVNDADARRAEPTGTDAELVIDPRAEQLLQIIDSVPSDGTPGEPPADSNAEIPPAREARGSRRPRTRLGGGSRLASSRLDKAAPVRMRRDNGAAGARAMPFGQEWTALRLARSSSAERQRRLDGEESALERLMAGERDPAPDGPPRILLVDDNLLLRSSVARLICSWRPDAVLAEADDGATALEAARALRPHVVLMDVRMPGCDGIEGTRRLKRELPETRVVMLTVSEDEADLFEAISAGADGYLLKDLRPEDLFAMLEEALAGEPVVSPGMARRVFRAFVDQAHHWTSLAEANPQLTQRETEVLELAGEGASNKEIAEALVISLGTVKNHIHNILDKLSLKNRAQIAAYARMRRMSGWP